MTTIAIPTPKIKLGGGFRFGKAAKGKSKPIPANWQTRVKLLYPDYVSKPFSQPHEEAWEWANDVDINSTPRPFVTIWPRHRGKSTTAELIAADWGIRGVRRYVGYVSNTQEQADKHIATIASILESDTVAKYNPTISRPKVSQNGNRSWNRKIVIAENFIVEAIGLNKAMRGGKIGWTRFDAFIFDDIDEKHDTEATIKKKEEIITTSILPAGADNCAVIFAQNLIHANSIATRLSRKPGTEKAADYLANRIVSGPFKAVDGLRYTFSADGNGELRWQITAGTSLWEGFGLDVCEAEINREGPTAFELESQHEIDTDSPLALLSTDILNATRVSTAPDFIRAGVAVDPSGGAGQCGIIAGGTAKINGVNHGYTVADNSTPTGTPSSEWAAAALVTYLSIAADCIFVERNFGGDMAKTTIQATKLVKELNGRFRAAASDDLIFSNEQEARNYQGQQQPVVLVLNGANVKIVEVSASRGKEVRAEPVASLYQQGRLHHVGFFPDLQKQWTQWEPGTKPSPDRLDADTWLWTGLGMVSGETPLEGVKENPFFS